MAQYIHHVPGRLRVKLTLLKRNDAQAADLHVLLEALLGIHKINVNPVTGSVTIHYEQGMITPQAIMQVLYDYGFCRFLMPISDSNTPVSKQKLHFQPWLQSRKIGKAVLEAAIGEIVAHSARALIGAIL